MNNTRGVALVGATATGKTALAARLARRIPDFELVSVDAMAVYRGLNIGTGKPTAEEHVGLTWHGLDLVDPDEEFSVAWFRDFAQASLAEIAARSHQPLFVGGTGLYHRAVVDNLSLPERYPTIAGTLETRAATEGLVVLYDELCVLDPIGATRMEPSNQRRVLRALEVCLGSGRPFSSFGPGLEVYAPSRYVLIGLRCEPHDLDARIEERLDAQLEAGFLEEVRGLLAHPGGLSRTAEQALGYRELIAHLQEHIGLSETRSEILSRTRRFARRQIAWFRRDPRIVWFDADASDLDEQVLHLLAAADDVGAEQLI